MPRPNKRKAQSKKAALESKEVRAERKQQQQESEHSEPMDKSARTWNPSLHKVCLSLDVLHTLMIVCP